MKRHLEFTLCSLLAAASARELVAGNPGVANSAVGGPPPGPSGAPIPIEQIPTGAISVSDNRVRFIRPGLTEECRVSMNGGRQDLVIAPEHTNGKL